MFFFIYFFYGRLILRPWLTEVRENFTRGKKMTRVNSQRHVLFPFARCQHDHDQMSHHYGAVRAVYSSCMALSVAFCEILYPV